MERCLREIQVIILKEEEYKALKNEILKHFETWGTEFELERDETDDLNEEQILDLLMIAEEYRKNDNVIWVEGVTLKVNEVTITRYFYDIYKKYRLLLE